ncbi:beta-ketoacyl-[acyl-carrier-protein] synthase family protein [Leucobacter chromiiresistens]|uniref:3-oxoacyl-[acyl-carrier-protein] synthase II n=1 Tax=Leucobacter chromiiresistens TaxID=1079994 RepID=A0A1H0Z7B6_9MICO|nr:beta-ketoacyl-[acyl-carrier-protein] synthase family protein [Leucobacter chromiiresistens]SDQ23325.1 3-oxoacyl-[acyl-carrier-protein] synthase II [Leucobacter chromiiresistens]
MSAPQGRRVVITGMGAVTPSGLGVDGLWDAVVHGRSAIRRLEGPGFEALPVRIGGRVDGFSADGLVPPGLMRRLSPVQLWAIAAADEALRQAGISAGAAAGGADAAEGGAAAAEGSGDALAGGWASAFAGDADRAAIIAATGSGPVDAMQAATRALDAGGPRSVPLALAVYGAPDAAAAILSLRYGATGPAQGVSATCASGAIALGEGLRRIRHGYADAVLVVGMEDCLGPVNLASNANLRALAAGFEEAPQRASRPFDRARTGFVMAQGAAAILLESADRASARGAAPLAELAGFGASSDAHHATAPHPEGLGAARAVAQCLADAGATPEHVDHVSLHGTGTPAGDAAELAALDRALGARARSIPLTATKSSTGHLLGAAGVVEAIISVEALRAQRIPPTLNLADPEFPEFDLVTGRARAAALRTVLSTSFGFGGHNGAILLRRAGEAPPEGGASMETTHTPMRASSTSPETMEETP